MPGWLALTLGSALLYAVSSALQKQGVTHWAWPPAARGARRWLGALCRNPAWAYGVLLLVPAGALEFQALSLGDVTLVKPLSRLQSVFIIAIGVTLLGERLAPCEWLGAAVMVLGSLVLATDGAASKALAPDPSLRWSISGALLASVGLLCAGRWCWPERLSAESFLGLAAGILFGASDVLGKVATGLVQQETGVFAIWSGSTLTSLFTTPEFVGFLAVGAVGFAVIQMAFRSGRVSLVGTFVAVGSTVLVVAVGALFLSEPLPPVRASGIAGILAGSLLLLRGGSPCGSS